jgi:hypothetical protein
VTPELQERVYSYWPEWFREKAEMGTNLRIFGLQIEDGWYMLLLRTLLRIEEHVESLDRVLARKCLPRFKVVAVKEKFGKLRIVVRPVVPPIALALLRATQESRCICELCGAHVRENQGRSQTRCLECYRSLFG